MIDARRTPAADRPLLQLPEHVIARVRRIAFGWALLAMIGLVLATQAGLLHHQPGGDAYEIQQRQMFLIAFGVAVLISWWSEIIGGTVASMSAAAILVFARNQLEPLDAAVVVIAFAVPGVSWILIYLHDLRPRAALVSIALVIAAVAAGAVTAQSAYDGIYGPSHPESTLPDLPASEVDWIWSGATTSTSTVVVAGFDHEQTETRLAVSDDPSFGDPMWFGSDTSDGRIARFTVMSLEPATAYHYAVELDGALERSAAGSFRTFPDGPASFTIAVGSCARVGSNGAVFDAIRELDPDLFVISGDLHYSNIPDDDVGEFLDAYREVLTQNAQAALYRSTPIAYVWDDHDYGANNADSTSPSRPAAMESYRAVVPHYPLAGDQAPIYQAFTIGRARVIMTDTRAGRSPAGALDDAAKTMLGARQLDWFEQQLLAADGTYPLIIWVNSVPWISAGSPGGDDWGGYTAERARIADFLVANDIDGLVMLSGDAHMVAIDDGTNSDFSSAGTDGFPVLHAAALDRPGHVKGGPYSEGSYPGSGQFGVVEVIDDGGDEITVELSGRSYEDETLVSYRFSVDARP